MRSRLLRPLLALVLPLASACGGATQTAPSPAPGAPASSPHARFEAFSDTFLKDLIVQFPSSTDGGTTPGIAGATMLGDHSYDDRWTDLSVEGDAARLRWVDATRADLASFSASLDGDDRDDASIITNFLDQTRFAFAEQRDAEHTPMVYTAMIGEGLDPLVSREFAPLDVRMKSVRGRLAGIPAIVAIAKKRLQHPARIATETAIVQTKGLVGLVDKDLGATTAKLPAQDQAAFEAARKTALDALRDFQSYLEKDLLPRSDGSFRAGKDAFTKIVRFTLDDPTLDPDALEKDARQAMADARAEMLSTAIELWPSIMAGPAPQPKTEDEKRAAVRAVLDKLAEDHPSDASILGDAKKVLADATAFVKANDLVTLPTEPCSVIEMPEYKRGVAVAYCDSSGPLEAKPETFVAIAPAPTDWPEARRASQYREYNESMLAELLVHEAMPGHYLQLMHANHVHDRLRSVLGDGAYVEGWAVYSEWLMAKHGFGGAKVRMQRLKMFLRTATNTVLDHEIHAGQMEEKDALAMMMNEGFQEEGEAVGKWRRARLSTGQLSSYFYGFREHLKSRERAEKRAGFSEHAYHDKILALGAPPMRIVRDRTAQ